jgi:hypothetical protein
VLVPFHDFNVHYLPVVMPFAGVQPHHLAVWRLIHGDDLDPILRNLGDALHPICPDRRDASLALLLEAAS